MKERGEKGWTSRLGEVMEEVRGEGAPWKGGSDSALRLCTRGTSAVPGSPFTRAPGLLLRVEGLKWGAGMPEDR